MPYSYQTQRPRVFTEEGQRMFLTIRDACQDLLSKAGAVRLLEAIRGVPGDTWDMLACVDRLVELGELKEITNDRVAAQHRVFVRYL